MLCMRRNFIVKHDLLQDHPKDQGKELGEINLTSEGEEAQPFFLSTSLMSELKEELLNHLREHEDIFAWTYVQMPSLDPKLFKQKLNIKKEPD